ncbi:MAG TPA: VOC family protein [Acidimicrobiales bacterium]|nr:VOC family protein [Acidimicrobiales bacterium]
MPVREKAPAGAPCWIELATTDRDRSRRFYTDVFGWDAEEPRPEFGGYFNFGQANERIAGCMQHPDVTNDSWLIYLCTADMATTVEEIKGAGGQVVAGPHPVADLGTMLVATDPAGTGIGFWEPNQMQGFGLVAEPGAPCWFQLSTSRYDEVVEFYRRVTGATVAAEPMPGGSQSILQVDGLPVAGILDGANPNLPEGHTDGWTIVFGASDTDALVDKVVAGGGRVLVQPSDSPYGRLAMVADPAGAQFSIVSIAVGDC